MPVTLTVNDSTAPGTTVHMTDSPADAAVWLVGYLADDAAALERIAAAATLRLDAIRPVDPDDVFTVVARRPTPADRADLDQDATRPVILEPR